MSALSVLSAPFLGTFKELFSKVSFSSLKMTQEIKFTPREMDILACIWAGIFSDKGIAKCLHVDPRGVETHVRNIMRKLGCNFRKEILSYLKKSDAIGHLRDRYQNLMSSEPLPPELQQGSSISSEDLIRFSVVKPSAKGILVAGSAVSLCIILGVELFLYKESSPPMPEIRSELAVPTDTVFLHRPVLLKKIQEILDTQTGIQTVALIGPGGAGKTTLAREYVHTQEASVIWEMNAETPQTLKTSFEELAHKLAKNQKDEKILRSLQEIKDPAQKEKEMISFVRERLQTHPNWALIYDNVETFADIQPYFPYDAKLWGHGKVILTTRNHTLGSNKHIQEGLVVTELTPPEKLYLFLKIMSRGNPSYLTKKTFQEATTFLEKIPSFPLDVSIAAYYLKETQTSYAAYLESLQKYNADFLNAQENLLKEMGDYTKTRYGIIALALDRLLAVHPDFKDLLLLMSLVDSQRIPRALLERYKDKVIVDNFIFSLKKYSLIINESAASASLSATFSLHRSTQAIGLAYFKDLLKEDEKKIFIKKAIQSIKFLYNPYSDAKCTASYLDKDYESINLLILHLEALVKNLNVIMHSNKIKGKYQQDLYVMLGNAHHKYSRNFVSAKKYFLKFLEINAIYHHIGEKYLANILKDLGDICVNVNDFDEAVRYCQQSINLCKKIPKLEHLLTENLKIIGYAFGSSGNFKKSKHYYKAALNEVYKVVDNKLKKELESEIYAQLASLFSSTYLNSEKANEAEKYALKALAILNASQRFYNSPQKQEILSCYVAKHKTTLGQVYNRLGKYKEAIIHGFREAGYIIENSLDRCAHHALKAQVSLGMGEALLRVGRLNSAEKELTSSILSKEQLGCTFATFKPKAFRAEARIRLKKFQEAYNDCGSAIKLAQGQKHNNDTNLLRIICIYHAAVAKYKQGDMKKSTEHFADFFKQIKIFSVSFLDEKSYNALESNGVFIDVLNNKKNKKLLLKKCFKNSAEIFLALFGSSHPFVCDYVLKNYEENKKIDH